MKENVIIENMEMAYEAIEKSFPTTGEGTEKAILKEYKGYIASFCTTLRQLGLMAALLNYFEADLFYKPKPNKASGHHLVKALAKMFNEADEMVFMNKVFTESKNNTAEYKKMEKLTAEYAITLKKTLRLFKIQS